MLNPLSNLTLDMTVDRASGLVRIAARVNLDLSYLEDHPEFARRLQAIVQDKALSPAEAFRAVGVLLTEAEDAARRHAEARRRVGQRRLPPWFQPIQQDLDRIARAEYGGGVSLVPDPSIGPDPYAAFVKRRGRVAMILITSADQPQMVSLVSAERMGRLLDQHPIHIPARVPRGTALTTDTSLRTLDI